MKLAQEVSGTNGTSPFRYLLYLHIYLYRYLMNEHKYVCHTPTTDYNTFKDFSFPNEQYFYHVKLPGWVESKHAMTPKYIKCMYSVSKKYRRKNKIKSYVFP